MILVLPFLILVGDYLARGLLGLSCIFVLMRAYSAYLHNAEFTKKTLLYVFFIPELITGPFRPFSEWSDIKYYNLLKRIELSNLLSNIIIILSSGIIYALFVSYFGQDYKLAKVIFIYIILYIQFRSMSEIVNVISMSLGLKKIANFNNPMLATSVTDFWSRWHMSLGVFAKTHLNQPMTFFLAKKGFGRNSSFFISIMLSFIFIGLWHNQSIQYLFFGLYFGIIVFVERVYANEIRFIMNSKIFSIAYTQTIHIIGFYFVSDYIELILIRPVL
ncbi:hypothetical protein AB4450_13065 [Vibrio breoganii]